MPILGVGTDILHLPRLTALLKRHPTRLPHRILSHTEFAVWLDSADSQEQCVRFLGVRWAVKEAAYKALYPSFTPTWKELSYLRPDPIPGLSPKAPKPTFSYKPKDIPQIDIDGLKLHASVSHDGEYVFASVVAEQVT